MHRAIAVALLLLVTGCKSNLWKDISEKDPTGEALLAQRGLCLGVTVPRESSETAIGVVVERVLKESPADQCGIVPGDEIRMLGGRVVRNARDLESALRAVGGRSGDNVGSLGATPTEVIVAFNGEERIVKCKLAPWNEQVKLARERCQTHAKTHESTVTVPFLFDYARLSIPVGMFRDYFGRSLSEPLLLYRDLDIVPLLGFFSLLRLETTSYRDAWRVQVLVWPLKFTKTDDEENLNGLLAPGEERFSVL